MLSCWKQIYGKPQNASIMLAFKTNIGFLHFVRNRSNIHQKCILQYSGTANQLINLMPGKVILFFCFRPGPWPYSLQSCHPISDHSKRVGKGNDARRWRDPIENDFQRLVQWFESDSQKKNINFIIPNKIVIFVILIERTCECTLCVCAQCSP